MDVSDRRMQVQLTQEAKIVSDFYSIRAIFAFVGFVSALRCPFSRNGRRRATNAFRLEELHAADE